MRSEKELLIASNQYAQEIPWKSWFHLVSTLLIIAALLTVACLDISMAIRIPASLLASLVIVRGFIIYHDYMHGAILRNSLVAKYIMYSYGMLVASPPSIWKDSHDDHHKNNCKTFGPAMGTFPVMTVEEYRDAGFWKKLDYIVQRHPISMVLAYLTAFIGELCIHSFIKSPRRIDCLIAPLLHVGIAVGLFMISWQAMVLGFLLPMTIAAALGCYLFYAQHNFPGVRRRHYDQWNYTFAALKSSSFMKMSPIMHWFTGNIGYHHVHHLNAKIPFYRLPEAMAGIEELQAPTTTTLLPWDIHKCLKLNLWNTETDSFVTYREAAELAKAA